MKLCITDQFLWEIFNAASEAEDALCFLIHPPRTYKDIFLNTDDPIYIKYHKMLNPRKFSQFIYYLKKSNYIKAKNLENKKAIIVTKKGISKILKTSFKIRNKQKRKDGKWVMIIFDVPQKHQKARNLLRSVLQNLGYKIFQHSVWITPYDVSEKTEKLLQAYSLDKYVKIFLIEEIGD